MKFTRATLFLTALVVAALLAGCGSTGLGGVLGGGDRDTSSDRSNDPYDDRDRYGDSVTDVRGTVESVDTLNRRIVVDSEGTGYRSNLRNGDEELVLYYDDRTTVAFQGQTYRPEDLERGDRIEADIEQSGNRLLVSRIDVVYDATGGGSDSQGVLGSTARSDEIRGVVRYVDTRDRTLEIEPSSGYRSTTGRSDVVVVHYDTQTTVEYQGRRYQPENLERGDEVEIEIRDQGGRLMAEEILVVGDSRSR
jgi:hypothetical protein